MKKSNNNYLFFLFMSLFLFISGCVNTGTSTLKLDYKPLASTEGSIALPLNIKHINFQDFRDSNKGPEIIGHRELPFGMSMGDV